MPNAFFGAGLQAVSHVSGIRGKGHAADFIPHRTGLAVHHGQPFGPGLGGIGDPLAVGGKNRIFNFIVFRARLAVDHEKLFAPLARNIDGF